MPSTVKTQMNIVLIIFLADLAVRKLIKISAILLKYREFSPYANFINANFIIANFITFNP